MITHTSELELWMKWIEEGDNEVLRAMQDKIDGLDAAGPELVCKARELAETYLGPDDLMVDDDAAKSETDDGTWVQAWVWVPKETK